MADSFNFRSGFKLYRPVPISSGTVVSVGDHLKLSSGRAIRMATATDNLTFIGTAGQRHGSADASGIIMVYIPQPLAIHEVAITSADVVFGDALQWAGQQSLVRGTSKPIACAMESKLAATTILCVYRLMHQSGNLDMVGLAS